MNNFNIKRGPKAKGTMGSRNTSKGKPLNRKKILGRLWAYLGRNRFLLVFALLLSVVSSLLGICGPKLSGTAINAISNGPGKVDFQVVFRCTALMALFYITSALLSYLFSRVMVHLSKGIAKMMRRDIFDHMAKLPVSFFDRYQTGDIISIITYDVDTVNQSLANDLVQIVNSLVTVIGCLFMMLTIAPSLLLIFLVTVPLTAFVTNFLIRLVRPLFRKRSATLGALNGFVEEMLSGQKTVRAYGREKEVLSEFDQKNNEAVEAFTRSESLGTITGPMVGLINNLSLALVCMFGALQFLSGRIGLGDLSSFVQYSRRFAGPINAVSNVIADLQSAFSAAERVFTLIDAEPEKPDADTALTLSNVQGDVEFKNVDFAYDPGKPIIENLNFHARPGTLTAIVGPTGAGKTTIINLLMRFYDVNAGQVLVDGHDIRSLTRASLRKAYTMVLQDTWLFHGTIYENLAYGKENATMEDVVQAAKAARIHSYISHLPEGYNTVLSDNGTSISKGQKQLLTIARAMLLDAHMLILDEATSNVDTRTEQKIQGAMRTLMKDKTCFVVAHRLSTIRSANHILVLDGGKVVEQGTHDSLMAAKGFYYRLYQSQFDAESA